MADDVDVANSRVELETESIISSHLNRSTRQQVVDEDGIVVCADCGGEMVQGRIMYGYANCLYCQTEAEHRDSIGKRQFR